MEEVKAIAHWALLSSEAKSGEVARSHDDEAKTDETSPRSSNKDRMQESGENRAYTNA